MHALQLRHEILEQITPNVNGGDDEEVEAVDVLPAKELAHTLIARVTTY